MRLQQHDGPDAHVWPVRRHERDVYFCRHLLSGPPGTGDRVSPMRAPLAVLIAVLLGGCSRDPNDGGRCPMTLAAGQKGPRAVTVDGANVYWTNETDGTVMKMPLGGGTPTALATGQSAPLAMAI